jgi:hypothetical protein
LVNPTTVTLTITLPDNTTIVVTPVSPVSTGMYQYDYQTVQAGRHSGRWVGTGSNPGAYVELFDVRPAVPAYIVSLADIKQQLNMTSTADDEELRAFLEAATGVIETYLGRAVVRRSFTEEHAVYGEILLNWTPVISLTSVVSVDGTTTWNTADLHVSTSGVVTAKAGATALQGDISVTYTAGAPVVPANWALAARIIVQHLWDTQRGKSGATHAGGLDTPGAGFTRYGFAIPNRAKELLTGGLAGV